MGSNKQKVRVRIYEVDHKKVKLYAVKNAKGLEEAYSDIISRVLDDEGKRFWFPSISPYKIFI